MVACLGIITLPAALPAWVLLAGISSGGALVYALTRISLAARTSAHATRLSGMAQSIGYLVAASGPVVVGWLRDSTGSWTPALAFVAAVAAVQATAAALRAPLPLTAALHRSEEADPARSGGRPCRPGRCRAPRPGRRLDPDGIDDRGERTCWT